EDELESLDQLHTEPDHHAAHHQCANNSPNECSMLRHWWDAEVLENENKDKNVIYAERVLDNVAGQKLESFVRAPNFPDQQIKQKGKNNINRNAMGGGSNAQLAPAVFELNEIEGQRDKDARVKGDPKPNTCV